MSEGVWRGVQFVLNPLNPLPAREAVLSSLISGALATVCGRSPDREDVALFKNIIIGICEMNHVYSSICSDIKGKIAELEKATRPTLCTVARELLKLYSNASPRLRVTQQTLVVLALVGLLYKLEKYTPLEKFEHFIPPEELSP